MRSASRSRSSSAEISPSQAFTRRSSATPRGPSTRPSSNGSISGRERSSRLHRRSPRTQSLTRGIPNPADHSGRLPDLRLDVPLGLHEHVDDRTLVDVLVEDLLGYAALEQLAPLVDLVGHR